MTDISFSDTQSDVSHTEKLFVFYDDQLEVTVYSKFCNDYLYAFDCFLDRVFRPVLNCHTRKSYDRAVKKLFPTSCPDDSFTYSTYLKALFDHAFTTVSHCCLDCSSFVHIDKGLIYYDLLDDSDVLNYHFSGLTVCFSFSVGPDDESIIVNQVGPFPSETIPFASRIFDRFLLFLKDNFNFRSYTSIDS